MGTLVGHVAPGFGFFVIGFWHLFNHIKLHAIHHNYRALPWFPTSFLRYLELYLIMMGCSISVAMELFIGPDRHQPFDPDGTIPSNHLHNFEHSSISLTFFVYAVSAIVLDKSRPKSHHDVLQFVGAVAFAQQLLLFHLHSADHMGVEGQYHWLLQLVIFVSLSTTLLGIALPNSFMVSFVRSLSILFQGVWLMTMGFMLWTPELIPKGCFMHSEEGHKVVRCEGEKSLARAKSLVNIEFSWFLILLAIFSVSFYSVIVKIYGDSSAEYFKVMSKEEEEAEEEEADVEAQKRSKLSEKQSFIYVGKATTGIDHMER
ncbi:hypothetical protein Nepgr_012119 [Nepenthes gracilis]|uniref:Transmembrane protein 45A n=1 Tax=Nepenthes gracilis TaxID=150966 RepID=A0AAD3SFE1_NEPGR|nr:hypothetical protein Nepgr_012119 [Nepenthes gracilis]